jgi:hypothetical protein
MSNAVVVPPSEVEPPNRRAHVTIETFGDRSLASSPQPRRRPGVMVMAMGVFAALLFGSAGWMTWRAHQHAHATHGFHAERAESALSLEVQRERLTSVRAETVDASAALSAALAALTPGATAASNDVDLAAARDALASLRGELDVTVAAGEFDAAERDRLISCLANAEQALGVAQTSGSHSSSDSAWATEECREAAA